VKFGPGLRRSDEFGVIPAKAGSKLQ